MKNNVLAIVAIVAAMTVSCKKDNANLSVPTDSKVGKTTSPLRTQQLGGGQYVPLVEISGGYQGYPAWSASWAPCSFRFSNLTWDLSATAQGDPYYASVVWDGQGVGCLVDVDGNNLTFSYYSDPNFGYWMSEGRPTSSGNTWTEYTVNLKMVFDANGNFAIALR